MPKPLENSQLIGDYYPEPERAQPDPDAAYDAFVQDQLDHPEEFGPLKCRKCGSTDLQLIDGIPMCKCQVSRITWVRGSTLYPDVHRKEVRL